VFFLDWSRVKTILIIAYLALNLVLGYRIMNDPIHLQGKFTMVSAEEVSGAKERLESMGITLRAQIPTRAPALRFLVLRQELHPDVNLAADLMGVRPDELRDERELRNAGDGEPEEGANASGTSTSKENAGPKEGSMVFSYGEERIILYENGVTVYLRGQAGGPAHEEALRLEDSFDETAITNAVSAFLRGRRVLPNGARYDGCSYDVRTGRYVVRYYQEYDGYSIYGGQVTFSIGPSDTNGGAPRVGGTPNGSSDGKGDEMGLQVEAFLIAWYEPRGYSERLRPVISPTEAVMVAAADITDSEPESEILSIDAINLGYYTEAYNAVEWEAPPVWRVKYTKGSEQGSLYVNAYTGEIEGENPIF
jgi:regulatory protein YycI of two-component signal transduction system YycFG